VKNHFHSPYLHLNPIVLKNYPHLFTEINTFSKEKTEKNEKTPEKLCKIARQFIFPLCINLQPPLPNVHVHTRSISFYSIIFDPIQSKVPPFLPLLFIHHFTCPSPHLHCIIIEKKACLLSFISSFYKNNAGEKTEMMI
jgi:hypothetical protein